MRPNAIYQSIPEIYSLSISNHLGDASIIKWGKATPYDYKMLSVYHGPSYRPIYSWGCPSLSHTLSFLLAQELCTQVSSRHGPWSWARRRGWGPPLRAYPSAQDWRCLNGAPGWSTCPWARGACRPYTGTTPCRARGSAPGIHRWTWRSQCASRPARRRRCNTQSCGWLRPSPSTTSAPTLLRRRPDGPTPARTASRAGGWPAGHSSAPPPPALLRHTALHSTPPSEVRVCHRCRPVPGAPRPSSPCAPGTPAPNARPCRTCGRRSGRRTLPLLLVRRPLPLLLAAAASPPPRLEPSPDRRFSFIRADHSSPVSRGLGFSFSGAAAPRLSTTRNRPTTSSRDNMEMSSIVSMHMASCEYFAGTTHNSLVTRSSSSTFLP